MGPSGEGVASEYDDVIKVLQRTDGFENLRCVGPCCNSMLNAEQCKGREAVVSSHRDHDTLCRMAQPPSAVPMPISHFLVRPRRRAADRTNAAIDASVRELAGVSRLGIVTKKGNK